MSNWPSCFHLSKMMAADAFPEQNLDTGKEKQRHHWCTLATVSLYKQHQPNGFDACSLSSPCLNCGSAEATPGHFGPRRANGSTSEVGGGTGFQATTQVAVALAREMLHCSAVLSWESDQCKGPKVFDLSESFLWTPVLFGNQSFGYIWCTSYHEVTKWNVTAPRWPALRFITFDHLQTSILNIKHVYQKMSSNYISIIDDDPRNWAFHTSSSRNCWYSGAPKSPFRCLASTPQSFAAKAEPAASKPLSPMLRRWLCHGTYWIDTIKYSTIRSQTQNILKLCA